MKKCINISFRFPGPPNQDKHEIIQVLGRCAFNGFCLKGKHIGNCGGSPSNIIIKRSSENVSVIQFCETPIPGQNNHPSDRQRQRPHRASSMRSAQAKLACSRRTAAGFSRRQRWKILCIWDTDECMLYSKEAVSQHWIEQNISAEKKRNQWLLNARLLIVWCLSQETALLCSCCTWRSVSSIWSKHCSTAA